MNVELKKEVQEKIDQIAKDANLPIEKACEYILTEFVENPGGRIYVGTWRSGNKGLRYVVQWPLVTGFMKMKGEEVVGRV